MKEAAGEANLTVVAIILIAVVVAVATPLVRNLMNSATYKSCCTDAGGVWQSECRYPKGSKQVDKAGMASDYASCQSQAGVSTVKSISREQQ